MIVLEPVAVVIRPNALELISVFGLPHTAWFRKLTASARTVTLLFSPIWNFLAKAASKRRFEGPSYQR